MAGPASNAKEPRGKSSLGFALCDVEVRSTLYTIIDPLHSYKDINENGSRNEGTKPKGHYVWGT